MNTSSVNYQLISKAMRPREVKHFIKGHSPSLWQKSWKPNTVSPR